VVFILGLNLADKSSAGSLQPLTISRSGSIMNLGVESFSEVSQGLFTMGVKNIVPRMTVEFISRFTNSEQFTKVFQEGMGLVEETANYLDGPGRMDSRLLDRQGAIAYATESMRLTTRLMQLASWLLLQRAIVSGEMSSDEASKEKNRISLAEIGAGNDIDGRDQLPEGLMALVERSLRLLERIRTIDAMMQKQRANVDEMQAVDSPVSLQMDQLQRAFGAR
jgi:regulator of CtrA degradation